jgi:hypothetical protein
MIAEMLQGALSGDGQAETYAANAEDPSQRYRYAASATSRTAEMLALEFTEPYPGRH